MCLICKLALLGLTVRLPWLDCPVSRLWSCGDVGHPAASSAQFVFSPTTRPWPRLPYMLLERPPRPHDWFGIWSMKEFCNLNCWIWDVFEEFFHWLDASNENCSLVHPGQTWIMSLSTSGHLFMKTSISIHFKSSTCSNSMADFQAWFQPWWWFQLDLSFIYKINLIKSRF